MKKVLIIVLTFCALGVFGQNTGIERNGFVFGIGAGGGVISISDSDQEVPFNKAQGALSLPNLKIGWMVNDRLAVLATLPGMIYDYEGKDRSFEALIPAVQYWAKDRWWINGGVGLAMDFPALYEKNSGGERWNFGCAVAAATGYEIVQKKRFAIDLQTQLHLGRAFLGNDQHRDGVAFSVGIGFNWY